MLTALRETNDALVGTLKNREQADAQAKRVASLREYARLSRLKFDNGYAGYLEVLYAENELFAAEFVQRIEELVTKACHGTRAACNDALPRVLDELR